MSGHHWVDSRSGSPASTRGRSPSVRDRLYTDLAVFELGPTGAIVTETFGITYDELVDRLDVPLRRVDNLAQRNSA
jgi:acyl CoA:acetate/3-ketoacid CoA transferase beta subunit